MLAISLWNILRVDVIVVLTWSYHVKIHGIILAYNVIPIYDIIGTVLRIDF